jgi:hypothetical protein
MAIRSSCWNSGNEEREDLTRAAADRLLRWVLLSTAVGALVIVGLAIAIADQRGLFLAVGAVYVITSLAAYFALRRSLAREFARRERQEVEES